MTFWRMKEYEIQDNIIKTYLVFGKFGVLILPLKAFTIMLYL
ncbi:hypothetical protein BN000_04715 [Neobacillus massiliamazoniensis]|uniref:Uncharacterized protein n=1 Tax=Neobacillus massiliamazoniensis TaxID=1499688 RepID=A0A0U1P334_9BACI|nr:hypothetical protein BN000_04715 [Neobacillus massiliamazoniensis]